MRNRLLSFNVIFVPETAKLFYLGKQYEEGLRMIEDESKAVELYMSGAELENPKCLYEMGGCFHHGYGVEKYEEKHTKAANVGHVGGQREMAYCMKREMGTEVNVKQSVKCQKGAAEAGDEDAFCF